MLNIFTNIRNRFENWLPKAVERDNESNWWLWTHMNEACRAFYSEDSPVQFSNRNAFALASTVSEIFFPIDAIADRVAGLQFDVVDNTGNIVEPPKNIARLLKSPNPMSSFSEMVYNSVFYELSDGNNYIYTKVPRSLKQVNPDTISSVWLLQPDKVYIRLKTSRPKYFDITSIADLIETFDYSMYDKERIDPLYIVHERSLPPCDYADSLKSPSPLGAACRNINNLLAVYSARYKVYVSNGNAGILTKEASKGNDIEAALDPVTRDAMIDDIKNRNGLVGDKRLWTVSPIPLKFIKTLATISELQPFDETMADSLQIAGIFGVDKDLIPLKEGTTYTNKVQAEKNLYANVVLPVAQAKAESFTKALGLDKIGLRLVPNTNNVKVLQEDKEVSYRGDGLLLDNVIKMKEAGLMDEADAKDISIKLTEKYKNE